MSEIREDPAPAGTNRGVIALAAALTVVGATLGTWAFWLEPASLRTTELELSMPEWPESCAGLRVAALSDLHVGSPHRGLDSLDDVVETTRAANPNLVLLAGDFVIQGIVGGEFVPPEDIARALAPLAETAGVFAVLGNHDWWLGAPRVRKAFEDAGIPVLDDASRPLVYGECRFWLAGVSDLWEGPHDVDAALADVPPDDPTILFTHNPDVFPDIPASVALTIAGHTHGGQVYLPGIGRPIVPSAYGERFAIGHIVEEERDLFVTPGIGTSIFPVRFLVPPEVSVVVLRSR